MWLRSTVAIFFSLAAAFPGHCHVHQCPLVSPKMHQVPDAFRRGGICTSNTKSPVMSQRTSGDDVVHCTVFSAIGVECSANKPCVCGQEVWDVKLRVLGGDIEGKALCVVWRHQSVYKAVGIGWAGRRTRWLYLDEYIRMLWIQHVVSLKLESKHFKHVLLLCLVLCSFQSTLNKTITTVVLRFLGLTRRQSLKAFRDAKCLWKEVQRPKGTEENSGV